MDDRLPGHLHQLGPVPMLNPLSMNSRFQPSHDEEEEFRLAMNVISKGSKRTFSVFRDTQVAEASPGGTESPLLEDDRYTHCSAIFKDLLTILCVDLSLMPHQTLRAM